MNLQVQHDVEPLWAFPDLVRTRREAAGWTQAKLAQNVHVAVATVGRWERGEAEPQQHLVLRLAEVLGLTVSAIEESLGTRRAPADVTSLPAPPPHAQADPEDLARFKAVVFAGMERGEGSDATWTANVQRLARFIGTTWEETADASALLR